MTLDPTVKQPLQNPKASTFEGSRPDLPEEDETKPVLWASQAAYLETIKAHYPVFFEDFETQSVSDWEHATMPSDSYGIILLDAQDEQLSHHLKTIQSKWPLAALLFVSQDHVNEHHPAAKHKGVDWLSLSDSPVEWESRLQRGLEVSHLRFLLNQSHQMDEMTRVYNYAYFVNRLNEKLSLSRRHFVPTTCVILDIAFYNVFMDTYGYGFVSDMLNQVSECVVDTVRREDIVARLGNSEIGILLSHSTAEGAKEMTKRLIKKLQQIQFHNGDQVEHIHLAAGVASFPMASDMDVNADGMIRYTRHALHQAKQKEEENTISVEIFNALRPFV